MGPKLWYQRYGLSVMPVCVSFLQPSQVHIAKRTLVISLHNGHTVVERCVRVLHSSNPAVAKGEPLYPFIAATLTQEAPQTLFNLP